MGRYQILKQERAGCLVCMGRAALLCQGLGRTGWVEHWGHWWDWAGGRQQLGSAGEPSQGPSLTPAGQQRLFRRLIRSGEHTNASPNNSLQPSYLLCVC